MALNHRDIPVTREMVHGWLEEYKILDQKPPIKVFLASHLDSLELGMSDTEVNTATSSSLEDTTSLVEMIYQDLNSYA